jgi:hypothetical protein
MIVSFAVAITFVILKKFTGFDPSETFKILSGVGITTVAWLLVTFLTKPTDDETLRSFYKRIRPGGPGWKKVVDRAKAEGVILQKSNELKWDVPTGIICMLLGVLAIYSALFTVGQLLYGNMMLVAVFGSISLVAVVMLMNYWKKLRMD